MLLFLGFSLFHMSFNEKPDKVRILLLILSILLVALFSLIRATRLVNHNAIMIPFQSFSSIWNSNWKQHGKYVAVGLIGNILLYVPFGLLMYKQDEKSTFLVITLCFFFSLFIELIQYFSRIGTFEVDDIIFNTYGAQVGIVVNQCIAKKSVKKEVVFIDIAIITLFLVWCMKSILVN